jgi:hypothetical protein
MHDTTAVLEDLDVCVASGLESAALLAEPQVQLLADHARLLAESRRLAQPSRDYAVARTLDDPHLITEDIAFDAADGSFLISSVRERKIIRLDRAGRSRPLPLNLTGWQAGFFGLALDPGRTVLWATMAADAVSPPLTAETEGHSAVLKINPNSGAVLARMELSDGNPHAFGDVTLDTGGTLYVSDGRSGGVYAVYPGETQLHTLVAPGVLRSPQTPASLDRARLLIPDYSRGIAVFDLQSRALSWLSHPRELALFGIDGLYAHGRTLVAIQNGTSPERILVLTLDAACRTVERWRVAVARVPGLGDPTHGVIVGGSFYFLVNSGWDRVADDGRYDPGAVAHPAQVWQLQLPRRDECK